MHRAAGNTRERTGAVVRSVPQINRILGWIIVALSIPATLALLAFVRRRSGGRLYAGPLVFDLFVVFSIIVDYALDLEFRAPFRPAIAVP